MDPVKTLIEEEPSSGYQTVARLLGTDLAARHAGVPHWAQFQTHMRPHHTLGMKAGAEAYASAA